MNMLENIAERYYNKLNTFVKCIKKNYENSLTKNTVSGMMSDIQSLLLGDVWNYDEGQIRRIINHYSHGNNGDDYINQRLRILMPNNAEAVNRFIALIRLIDRYRLPVRSTREMFFPDPNGMVMQALNSFLNDFIQLSYLVLKLVFKSQTDDDGDDEAAKAKRKAKRNAGRFLIIEGLKIFKKEYRPKGISSGVCAFFSWLILLPLSDFFLLMFFGAIAENFNSGKAINVIAYVAVSVIGLFSVLATISIIYYIYDLIVSIVGISNKIDSVIDAFNESYELTTSIQVLRDDLRNLYLLLLEEEGERQMSLRELKSQYLDRSDNAPNRSTQKKCELIRKLYTLYMLNKTQSIEQLRGSLSLPNGQHEVVQKCMQVAKVLKETDNALSDDEAILVASFSIGFC
jgi:hypothetical protein